MSARAVVFDIGGVLVDWRPELAWLDELGSRAAVEAFMDRVGFGALNARADGGERFADLAQEVDDAEDRRLVEAYVELYPRTVRDRIEGTWRIAEDLRAKGISLHAITNWSAETWPRGLEVQPGLGELFGVTVVSGREGVMKPDRRIFDLLCTRAEVAPGRCIFIDDGAYNAEGARAAGMDAIHFTGAEALRGALADRGLI